MSKDMWLFSIVFPCPKLDPLAVDPQPTNWPDASRRDQICNDMQRLSPLQGLCNVQIVTIGQGGAVWTRRRHQDLQRLWNAKLLVDRYIPFSTLYIIICQDSQQSIVCSFLVKFLVGRAVGCPSGLNPKPWGLEFPLSSGPLQSGTQHLLSVTSRQQDSRVVHMAPDERVKIDFMWIYNFCIDWSSYAVQWDVFEPRTGIPSGFFTHLFKRLHCCRLKATQSLHQGLSNIQTWLGNGFTKCFTENDALVICEREKGWKS